jgi:formiminotetrahydrofolate cyclodeaminase
MTGGQGGSYQPLPVGGFLDALAAGAPAPAAGSAAALVLAQAAALCAKSARLSARQLTADQAGQLTAEAEQARAEAASLIDEDARAFSAVIEQSRRPAGQSGSAEGLAAALSRAADVPMRIVELAAAVARLGVTLAADGNPALRGDALAAGYLAQAAARSAAALVRINLASTPGDPRPARAQALLTSIDQLDQLG